MTQAQGLTFVATPDDGTCGIGTYTGELEDALDEHSFDHSKVTVPLASVNPFDYLWGAIRAGLSSTDTVHLQHEYGIFGKKSIYSWVFFPVLFLLCKLTGKELLVTMHSAWTDETISPPLYSAKRVYVWLNNQMIRRTSTHIIFLSENAKEKFVDSTALPDHQYSVYPHGVPTETSSLSTAEAKQHLGYDADEVLVVEPGYVRPEKNQDTFIKLAESCPSETFVIAGGVATGETSEFFEAITRDASTNVDITGSLDSDSFKAVFRAADLVVLPYDTAHQSGIVNWCIAHECPILGNDIRYFRDLHDKHGAVEVADLNSDSGVEALKELLEDEDRREELAERMREYKRTRTMPAVASQHIDLYNRLS